MPARVKFGTVLAESARFYFANGGVLLQILLLTGVATATIFIATMAAITGFSIQGAGMDPTVFRNTLTGPQWAMGAAGFVAVMIVLSFGFAASVHASAGVPTVRAAFNRIRSGPMQIFWLQCVIYALALRYSTFAAPLLFVLIAFAVPVAMVEDVGPNAAADRAWEVSEGYRRGILLLEVGLIAVSVAVVAAIGFLFLQPNSPYILIAPLMRAAISWILMAFVIGPYQFLFVALTRLYMALTASSEPALHARAASNVRS